MNLKEIENYIQEAYLDTFKLVEKIPYEGVINTKDILYIKSTAKAYFMNGVYHFNDQSPEMEDLLKKTVLDLKQHGHPFLWRLNTYTTHHDKLEKLLLSEGLIESDPLTSVYLELNTKLFEQFQFKNKVEFNLVQEDNFERWFTLFSESFGVGGDPTMAQVLKDYQKYCGGDIFTSYLGTFKGEAVSCVSVIKNENPLGALFNIGSSPKYRGQSFGMQAALFGGKKLLENGKQYVGQFGSLDGVKSYTKLGAKIGSQYKTYGYGL